MYTAEIVKKDIERGVLKLTIEFTNGTDLFSDTFYFLNPSKDVIDNAISELIDRANKAEAFNVKELSKHPVKESIEKDFEDKKAEEKIEREKPKEETPIEVTPVEPIENIKE